jgi:hypothetical protein
MLRRNGRRPATALWVSGGYLHPASAISNRIRADVMIMRMISPTAMLTICRFIDCRIIIAPGERYTHRLRLTGGTIKYTRTSP